MNTKVSEPLSALAAELGSYLEELAPAEARVAEIKAHRDSVERAIRAHPDFSPVAWRAQYGTIATVREGESSEWVGLDPRMAGYEELTEGAYELVDDHGDGVYYLKIIGQNSWRNREADYVPPARVEVLIRRKTGIPTITFARLKGRKGDES